jgi:hypothetical protein
VSVKVEVGELAERLAEYGFAYLITVGDDRKAHLVAVTPVLVDGGLVVGGLGRHSLTNAGSTPAVTLVWPPTTDGGYSLIVDGTATVGDEAVTVAPAKAILHRPAPGADGQRVGNDCEPVRLTDDG